jgi:hypothetical protein
MMPWLNGSIHGKTGMAGSPDAAEMPKSGQPRALTESFAQFLKSALATGK